MKKALIIGPLGDEGGREIEAGFIASALSDDFKISVFSTANITAASQLYHYPFKGEVTSLKEAIYKNYFSVRPATLLSYLKNGRHFPVHYYVNNKFNTVNGYRFKELEQLRRIIRKVDVVFIIAHLFSMRTKEVIEIASEAKKPIIFRTTGLIEERKIFPGYLENVTYYLHHSQKNANRLHDYIKNQNYAIVDQAAPNEELLLQIPPVNREPTNFAAIGRFSSEKNFHYLISEFKKCCRKSDKLYLIGEGELQASLIKEKGDCDNILFLGQMKSKEIAIFFGAIDCLIIPSRHEAGPLVGVEAMAAARIILSSQVGAMPERLKSIKNNFWFDPDKSGSLEKEILRVKKLSIEEARQITGANREKYLGFYLKEIISRLYIKTVNQVLK